MTGMDGIDAERLAQLAQEKEQEWRQLQQLRIQSLEQRLKDTERELGEERGKLHQLKEDFKYNLKLLNDRDAELATYDTLVTDLRHRLVTRDSEISELKIKLHEMENTVARESSMKNDLQVSYQKRIREKQEELDQYRLKKDAEMEEERRELESFRRNLQRQITDVEEELELQKRELTAGFEDAMRKRDHETRHQLDEMNTTVLAHELKVKLLSKELEMCKANLADSSNERQSAEGHQQQLEKQLRNKEWQLQDVTAMKNAKISELEGKLKSSEGSIKGIEDNYQRKLKELDKSIRDKDLYIKKLKEALEEKDHDSENKLRGLESKLEQAEIKVRELEWAKQDSERDKQALANRLEEELGEAQRQVEKLLSDKSKATVTQDMDMQKLREREQQLQISLQESRRHVQRYQKELKDALEQQALLEQSKAQLDLDWQGRLEEVERLQYERSEDLVKNLIKARDDAMAEVKQKDRELQDKSDLIKVLTGDRDHALATIKQYGLKVDHNIDVSVLSDMPRSAGEQVRELQQQNANLREVIRQMRGEMENLGHQLPQPATSSKQDSVTQEYVKNLEKELHSLKSKVRQLEQGGQASDDKKEPAEAAAMTTDNVLIQQHIASLNNTISQLRSEKVDLSAQLRKQQTRLQYLESTADQVHKLQMEKQVEVEGLQYELGAMERRHKTEADGLRRQLTETQLQLEEARREADEYYKANLQHNQRITNMEHELSTVKMELANKRQPVTFGAQEMMIQQLHEEIERLQQERRGEPDAMLNQPLTGQQWGIRSGPGHWADRTEMGQLRSKLHQAAKHIRQLASEKQQLIDVNNRLRADLNRNGIKPTIIPRAAPPPPSQMTLGKTGMTDRSQISGTLESKLRQLEQLQYEITKQQLSQGHAKDIQILRLSQESADDDFQPKSILKNSGPQEIPTKLEKPERLERTAEFDIPRPQTAESDTLMRPGTGVSELTQRSSGQLLRSSDGLLMSSVGGESLAEIWQMLDQEGPSPRPFTPHKPGGGDTGGKVEYLEEADSSTDNLMLRGHQPPVSDKPHRDPLPLSKKASGKLIPKRPGKPKIRNYSVKDIT